MVKVSITLPNSTQITLESEETEIIHEVVGIVLRDLPKALMVPVSDDGEDPSRGAAPQKSSNVGEYEVTLGSSAATDQPNLLGTALDTLTTAPPPAQQDTATPSVVTRGLTSTDQQVTPEETLIPGETPTSESVDAFVKFCESARPMGDMRKVVVAAEGAHRFLGMDSVDAGDLARLFDLAAWRRPHNFTQTLRNAARDKFRWLERMPGRTGRYATTDLGQAVTLSE